MTPRARGSRSADKFNDPELPQGPSQNASQEDSPTSPDRTPTRHHHFPRVSCKTIVFHLRERGDAPDYRPQPIQTAPRPLIDDRERFLKSIGKKVAPRLLSESEVDLPVAHWLSKGIEVHQCSSSSSHRFSQEGQHPSQTNSHSGEVAWFMPRIKLNTRVFHGDWVDRLSYDSLFDPKPFRSEPAGRSRPPHDFEPEDHGVFGTGSNQGSFRNHPSSTTFPSPLCELRSPWTLPGNSNSKPWTSSYDLGQFSPGRREWRISKNSQSTKHSQFLREGNSPGVSGAKITTWLRFQTLDAIQLAEVEVCESPNPFSGCTTAKWPSRSITGVPEPVFSQHTSGSDSRPIHVPARNPLPVFRAPHLTRPGPHQSAAEPKTQSSRK